MRAARFASRISWEVAKMSHRAARHVWCLARGMRPFACPCDDVEEAYRSASEWPKQCSSCGREVDEREWRSLDFVGLQEDGASGHLELRNHDCGSTLAVVVALEGLPDALRDDLAKLFQCEADELERRTTILGWSTPDDAKEIARLRAVADAVRRANARPRRG